MIEFSELQTNLKELNKDKSLRNISDEDYGGEVTYGVIARCIKGIEPKDNDIRKRLGLAVFEYQLRDPVTGRYVEKG